MSSFKQLLFTNWHAMRWIRLIAALALVVEAFRQHDALLGLLSAFFFYQTITNTGCCGGNSCSL